MRTSAQNVVTTVPVGFAPVGVGVDPSTNRIYVANQNADTVSVIDGLSNTELLQIPFDGSPQEIAVNPGASRVYVTARSGFLRFIDTRTNTIVSSVPVPFTTSAFEVAVNPTTNRVYVTSRATTSVTVIDGVSAQIVAALTMPAQTEGVAVNSATNRVYIVLAASIAILDGATNAVIDTIPTNFSPRSIAVNPVTNRIYVTHSDGPGLVVIDGATNAVVTDITTVGGILDVAVNPTTNRVYTPATGGGLAIVNGATNSILTTLGLEGTTPVGIGVNPTTNRVYTSDVISGRMFVIDDSPAVPTSTPTATSIQATPTPTRTATPTASPTAPTLTPTVPSGGLGGKGLGITSGSGGVFLTWQTGVGQTGYSVLRAAPNELSFLPPNGLGPNETSFFDSTAPPGLDCYALVLAGTNPQRYSDAICALMGFHSPTGSPEAFTLRLNQSQFASLTWNPPLGPAPDGYVLAPLGGNAQILPGTATSASQVPTNGATCFVLGALQGGVLTGFTDIACGIPGFSNLNS